VRARGSAYGRPYDGCRYSRRSKGSGTEGSVVRNASLYSENVVLCSVEKVLHEERKELSRGARGPLYIEEMRVVETDDTVGSRVANG